MPVIAAADVFTTIRANLTEIRKSTEHLRTTTRTKLESGELKPLTAEMKGGASLVAGQVGTILLDLIGKSMREMDEFSKDPCCQEHLAMAANATLTAVAVLSAAYTQIMGDAGVMLDISDLDADIEMVLAKVEQNFIHVPPGKTPSEVIAEANLSRLGDVTKGYTPPVDPTQPLDPDVSGMARN